MKEAITQLQQRMKLSSNIVSIYESITYETKDQFVHDLLQRLFEERQLNIVERNMRQAAFPGKKTLESYDFSRVTFPDKLTLDSLKDLNFLDYQENLIFMEISELERPTWELHWVSKQSIGKRLFTFSLFMSLSTS